MLHPCNCHHFFVVGCLHPYNCHHFLVVLPPKSSSGAPRAPQGCPGPPSAFRERPKKEGSPPKSGFWGARVDFGIAPGPPKNAFWPPKTLLGAFWPPKMEPFSVKIESGSEKRDFRKSLILHYKIIDFRGRSLPESTQNRPRRRSGNRPRKKDVKKAGGPPQKWIFGRQGRFWNFAEGSQNRVLDPGGR